MAVLTSKTQPSGLVGDTYVDAQGTWTLVTVWQDGVYSWQLQPSSGGGAVPAGANPGERLIWDGTQWIAMLDQMVPTFPVSTDPASYTTDLTNAGYNLIEGTHFWDIDNNKLMVLDTATSSWIEASYSGPTINAGTQVGQILEWDGSVWDYAPPHQFEPFFTAAGTTAGNFLLSQYGAVGEGNAYYDTSSNQLMIHDGTSFQPVGGGSTIPDGTYQMQSLAWNNGTGEWFVTAGQAAQMPVANSDAAANSYHVGLQGNALQGSLYYDISTNEPKYYDGSAWQVLGGGGGGSNLFDANDTLNAFRYHQLTRINASNPGILEFHAKGPDSFSSGEFRVMGNNGHSFIVNNREIQLTFASGSGLSIEGSTNAAASAGGAQGQPGMFLMSDGTLEPPFWSWMKIGTGQPLPDAFGNDGTVGQVLTATDNGDGTVSARWQDAAGGSIPDGTASGNILEWDGFNWVNAPSPEFQSLEANSDFAAQSAFSGAGISNSNIPGGATFWHQTEQVLKVRNPTSVSWETIATIGSATNSSNGVLVLGDIAIQWGEGVTGSSVTHADITFQVPYISASAYTIQVTAGSGQVTQAMIGGYANNTTSGGAEVPQTTGFRAIVMRHDVSPPSQARQNNAPFRWMTIGRIA